MLNPLPDVLLIDVKSNDFLKRVCVREVHPEDAVAVATTPLRDRPDGSPDRVHTRHSALARGLVIMS